MNRAILPLFLVTLSIGYVVSNVQILKSGRDKASPAPISLGARRLSDRVIAVVLDGVPIRVGYNDSVMPFLVELSHDGAHGVLWAPEETTTPAGVRALATGENPSAADVLDMFRAREYKGWTVFDDVVGRGETVSLSGDKAWTSLLASRDPSAVRVTDTETRLYQDARSVLAIAARRLDSDKPPSLTVVHIGETDKLGHLYGTEDTRYIKRMREIDAELRDFVRHVVTDRSTLVITADHGNDVHGSHGGEGDIYRRVPIIMFGKGIRHGAEISMDARAFPGVLAVLLGTRIPVEMQAVIPVDAFDLTDSERATLLSSNALQLGRLAALRAVALPTAALDRLQRIKEIVQDSSGGQSLGTATQDLSSVVSVLDATAPVSLPRILWATVLFFALFVGAIEVLWPERQPTNIDAIFLCTAAGLVVLQMALPHLVIPLMSLVLAVETLSLVPIAIRFASLSALVGAAATVGVILMPAVRFAYMPQLKAFIHMGMMRFVLSTVFIAMVAWLVAARQRHRLRFSRDLEPLVVALCLLATVLLTPFATIPVLLIVLTLLAVRAAGASWVELTWIAGALGVFFIVSERIGFPDTGENPTARYAYAIGACTVAVTVLLTRASGQRRWLALGWLFLVPAWPFGYVKLAGANSPYWYTTLVVFLALATAAWVASREIRFWWAYVPLVATLSYHVHSTHSVFWVALVSHIGVMVTAAISLKSNTARRSIIALTATSGLILMSPPALAPSVVAIALGILVITRINIRDLKLSTVVLVAAALLVLGRYAVIGVFSHGPTIDCALQCVDEASGFLGFDETRWTWGTALVSLKMLFASLLVISVVFSSATFDAVERRVFTASLLLVFAVIAKGAMHSALAFGMHGGRLGMSLSQAGYSAIVLLAIALGYLAYKLLLKQSQKSSIAIAQLSKASA